MESDEHMKRVQVLGPRKGHTFTLLALMFTAFSLMLLLLYTGFDVLMLDGEDAPSTLGASIAVALALPFVASRSGRYAFIDRRLGISKPRWVRGSRPTFMNPNELSGYIGIHSVWDREMVTGVMVETQDGKQIRYLERKTPGCVGILLEVLREWNIPELPDQRKVFG